MQWWRLPKLPIWDEEGNVVTEQSICAVWSKFVKGDRVKQYGLWTNGELITRIVRRHGPDRYVGDWRRHKKYKVRARAY